MDTLQSDLEALSAAHPELATLRAIDGLAALLAWCRPAGVDAARMEIIVQDEYTHDAILAWRDRFLVFGLT